jgi:hypothetical protein
MLFGIIGSCLIAIAMGWLWLMTLLPPGGIIGALAVVPGLCGIYCIQAAVKGPADV